MTAWLLAVDFGTTNTSAAACALGRPDLGRPVKLSSSSNEMPSAVLVKDDGRILTGETALNSARASRVDAFEPTPKRRIGEGSLPLAGDLIPVVDLVDAVLAQVAQKASRQFDDVGPAQLRLTHPAKWAESRQAILVEAASKAGLPTPVLVPEPVAAATYYAHQPSDQPADGPIAVYDLGGGTFDVAVLRRSGDGFEVLAKEMVDPLGGEAFDVRLLDLVREALLAKGLSPLWERFQGPDGLRWRRTLLDEIRRAKHQLSEELQADVAVQAGDDSSVISLTRGEFNARIAPDLARSIVATRSALEHARVSASQLERLYLVGGSSFIPAVSEAITHELGVRPARFQDPKMVTALGALHVEARGQDRSRSGGAGAGGYVPEDELKPVRRSQPGDHSGEKVPHPPPGDLVGPEKTGSSKKAWLAIAALWPSKRAWLVIAAIFLVVPTLVAIGTTEQDDEPGVDLTALHVQCDDGDMDACDDLYREAPSGSTEEAFGDTCGETQEPTSGNCSDSTKEPTTPTEGLNEAETGLLEHVPEALKDSCSRGEADMREAIAALRCESRTSPDDLFSGTVPIVYFQFATPQDLDAYFDYYLERHDLESTPPGGSCDPDSNPSFIGVGTWSINGVEKGRKLCHIDRDGDPAMTWTHQDLLIAAWAWSPAPVDMTSRIRFLFQAVHDAGPD